jgi:PTH1 family peptidyl-tRNA hydrolase
MLRQPAGHSCVFFCLPLSDVLIVGLGNPGKEYSGTRHNLGEECVRALATGMGAAVDRKRWSSLVGSCSLDSARVWFVLPQTYMNESGRAVRAAVRDLGASAGSDVWIVHDELDLPLCRLRIQLGGSAAGNNGVRSVISHLGTDQFWRFRVGVGKPASSAHGVKHVLGRWTRAEAERVPLVVDGVADALRLALSEGLVRAQEIYNRSGALRCAELP